MLLLYCLFLPLIKYALIKNNYSKTELYSKRYTIEVPLDLDKERRLDVYISDNNPAHTRSYIGNLCDEKLVTVNDKVRNKSYKVKKGDRISFEVEEKEITDVAPENIPLDVLYEDDEIIAVSKPVGMVVHPAVGSPNGTFVNALLYYLGSERSKLLLNATVSERPVEQRDSAVGIIGNEPMLVDLPETPEAASASPAFLRPGIVHRLDKGTSGVLLAGKSTSAVAKLSKLFALRQIRKVYIAVCVGHPGETTIIQPIGRSEKNRQLMCCYDGPPGKPAITHIKTISFDGKLSVCLVRIETGRTHQIRVHLKERRTPIVGDDAYGNGDWNNRLMRSDNIDRPLLHAYETEFIHPFNSQQMVVRAPLPDDMRTLINKISSHPSASVLRAAVDFSTSDELSEAGAIIDEETGLLTCSTDIFASESSVYVDGSEYSVDSADSVEKKKGSSQKSFVPIDRLAVDDEDDWLSFDLPETDNFLNNVD